MFFILTISSIPPRPTKKKKKTKRKRKKGRTIIKYFNVNGTEDGKICSSVCVCVRECVRERHKCTSISKTNTSNGPPPPASSNIFSIDRGPKVVRIMSATACQVLDTDQNQMIEQQNRKF